MGRMDTQKIVKDLLDSGLSQTELSALVGCGQSTIAQYLSGVRGQRPSFAFGAKLLSLHKARCKSRRNTNQVATPSDAS